MLKLSRGEDALQRKLKSDSFSLAISREDGGLSPVLNAVLYILFAAKVIKNLVTSKFFSKKMDLFLFVVKLEPKTSDLGENGIEKTQFLA